MSLCDSLVAEVLILSALNKLANPGRYRQAAAAYSLYRRVARRFPIPTWLPWLLPLLEVVAGALILIPNARSTPLLGGALASLLCALFLLLLDRDDRVSITNCGCWGRDDVTVPRAAFMWRNGALAGLAIAALGLAATPFPWCGFVIVAVAGHWLWGAAYGTGFGASRTAHFLAHDRSGAVQRPGSVAVAVVSGRWCWAHALGSALGGVLVVTGLWLLLQGSAGLSP